MIKKIDIFTDESIEVPAFKPWISKDDKKNVMNSLSQKMLTLGPNLNKFEELFAEFTNAKYAIAVSNCTAALHLSLKSLGIKKDDEVIIPDLTFVADANSVIASNAKPVIVDINKDDFSISIEDIKKKITKKTKAIILVHIYGKACNMSEIVKISKEYNLHLIEDCAHAVGTYYKNKHVGNFGITGCFSFYPTKNLTTAEGGMVITNSKFIAKKIEQLRSHGMTKSLSKRYSDKYPWEYDVKEPGYNYRLDEIRSSLGISQLSRLNQMNELRKNAAQYYSKNLNRCKGIIVPKIVNDKSHSYHLYVIRITESYGISRNKLFEKLKNAGIITTVNWKPLHKFSAYKQFLKKSDKFPITSKVYEQILALPLFPQITRKQQDKVIMKIKEYSDSKN